MCTPMQLGMHVFSDCVLRDFTAYTNLFLRQRTHRNVWSRWSHNAGHRNTSYCAWFISIKMRHYCRRSLNRSLRSVVYPCPSMARHFFQKNDVQWETDAKQGPLLPVRWYHCTTPAGTLIPIAPLLPVRWHALHNHNAPNNIQYKSKQRLSSSAEGSRHPSRRQRRG